MRDIANLGTSLPEKITCIRYVNDGDFDVSSQEKMSGSKQSSNHIKNEEKSNTKYNYVPAHKVIVKDINKLEIANINSSDLMKNISIKCQSLSNFLKFYQTLKHHFSNYNAFIRSVNEITGDIHYEPAGLRIVQT